MAVRSAMAGGVNEVSYWCLGTTPMGPSTLTRTGSARTRGISMPNLSQRRSVTARRYKTEKVFERIFCLYHRLTRRATTHSTVCCRRSDNGQGG